jgi:hypothetical protein
MALSGIYRCEDGHLFVRSYASLLFVPHLGMGKARAKCPVDGKKGTITEVKRKDLTPAQIAEAESWAKK